MSTIYPTSDAQSQTIGTVSAVTKDVEENELWVGNPARMVPKLM